MLIVPFAAAILQVTALGNVALPVMFAFGILGRRIAREPGYEPVVPRAQAAVS